MKVLFITWDGPDQTYLESLFLPTHARLRAHGISIHVMQFSWGDDALGSAAAAANRLGIPYTRVPVVRYPKTMATALSIARGAFDVRRYARRHAIDVLMPRSVLPALMTLVARRTLRVRTVYDADGFMPDERVDFSGWSSRGVTYRILRDAESQMLRVADGVVTRTAKAKDILLARAGAGTDSAKIHVIPNAKDAEEFCPLDAARRAQVRHGLGVSPAAPLLIYVGSLGPQYYPERMFAFFAAVLRRRSDARLLFLTGQESEARAALARSLAAAGAVTIRRVPPAEVAPMVAVSDLGIALRRAAFSQLGVSPIKVAEYLLCGVPVLSTRGIGDLDEQLLQGSIGRLLDAPGDLELEAAADWFVNQVLSSREELRSACRARGVELFGLEQAVPRYLEALGGV